MCYNGDLFLLKGRQKRWIELLLRVILDVLQLRPLKGLLNYLLVTIQFVSLSCHIHH